LCLGRTGCSAGVTTPVSGTDLPSRVTVGAVSLLRFTAQSRRFASVNGGSPSSPGMLLHSNENPTDHRRWMIRAFAIGIGIGTTRIWLALFGIAGLDFASSFGPAFWISFSLHAVAAELWLRAFPNPPELAHEPPGATSSPRPAAAAEAAG